MRSSRKVGSAPDEWAASLFREVLQPLFVALERGTGDAGRLVESLLEAVRGTSDQVAVEQLGHACGDLVEFMVGRSQGRRVVEEFVGLIAPCPSLLRAVILASLPFLGSLLKLDLRPMSRTELAAELRLYAVPLHETLRGGEIKEAVQVALEVTPLYTLQAKDLFGVLATGAGAGFLGMDPEVFETGTLIKVCGWIWDALVDAVDAWASGEVAYWLQLLNHLLLKGVRVPRLPVRGNAKGSHVHLTKLMLFYNAVDAGRRRAGEEAFSQTAEFQAYVQAGVFWNRLRRACGTGPWQEYLQSRAANDVRGLWTHFLAHYPGAKQHLALPDSIADAWERGEAELAILQQQQQASPKAFLDASEPIGLRHLYRRYCQAKSSGSGHLELAELRGRIPSLLWKSVASGNTAHLYQLVRILNDSPAYFDTFDVRAELSRCLGACIGGSLKARKLSFKLLSMCNLVKPEEQIAFREGVPCGVPLAAWRASLEDQFWATFERTRGHCTLILQSLRQGSQWTKGHAPAGFGHLERYIFYSLCVRLSDLRLAALEQGSVAEPVVVNFRGLGGQVDKDEERLAPLMGLYEFNVQFTRMWRKFFAGVVQREAETLGAPGASYATIRRLAWESGSSLPELHDALIDIASKVSELPGAGLSAYAELTSSFMWALELVRNQQQVCSPLFLGSLLWILLQEPGLSLVLEGEELPNATVVECLSRLAQRHAGDAQIVQEIFRCKMIYSQLLVLSLPQSVRIPQADAPLDGFIDGLLEALRMQFNSLRFGEVERFGSVLRVFAQRSAKCQDMMVAHRHLVEVIDGLRFGEWAHVHALSTLLPRSMVDPNGVLEQNRLAYFMPAVLDAAETCKALLDSYSTGQVPAGAKCEARIWQEQESNLEASPERVHGYIPAASQPFWVELGAAGVRAAPVLVDPTIRFEIPPHLVDDQWLPRSVQGKEVGGTTSAASAPQPEQLGEVEPLRFEHEERRSLYPLSSSLMESAHAIYRPRAPAAKPLLESASAGGGGGAPCGRGVLAGFLDGSESDRVWLLHCLRRLASPLEPKMEQFLLHFVSLECIRPSHLATLALCLDRQDLWSHVATYLGGDVFALDQNLLNYWESLQLRVRTLYSVSWIPATTSPENKSWMEARAKEFRTRLDGLDALLYVSDREWTPALAQLALCAKKSLQRKPLPGNLLHILAESRVLAASPELRRLAFEAPNALVHCLDPSPEHPLTLALRHGNAGFLLEYRERLLNLLGGFVQAPPRMDPQYLQRVDAVLAALGFKLPAYAMAVHRSPRQGKAVVSLPEFLATSRPVQDDIAEICDGLYTSVLGMASTLLTKLGNAVLAHQSQGQNDVLTLSNQILAQNKALLESHSSPTPKPDADRFKSFLSNLPMRGAHAKYVGTLLRGMVASHALKAVQGCLMFQVLRSARLKPKAGVGRVVSLLARQRVSVALLEYQDEELFMACLGVVGFSLDELLAGQVADPKTRARFGFMVQSLLARCLENKA